ncbi:hypothetical protein GCK72_020208 [Caenorhabditis remanei]|uniref:Glycosyltransferase family 92 protein n=1 Tax=Caenorhabditis remanei TaxID=31234 RepID=A0A6A5GGE3_CAERE|nr:hypothetical protein GCK72_020208 [Caenorhabditis remanei]KAF1753651.1 hypothetical protein GCK72_020208 [Caenorhabditis remanei]
MVILKTFKSSLCIVSVFLFVFFIVLNDNLLSKNYSNSLKNMLQLGASERNVDDLFPIKFYHIAFVDYRTNTPRLRIFSISGCLGNSKYLNVDIYQKGVRTPTRMKVYGRPLEGHCPSAYWLATPCFFSAHTFEANLSVTGGLTKVVIELGLRQVELSVQEIHNPVQIGITMCVQPVYYYTQWQNIVLYIEAWRAQGATRFIVFYHSSTKDTRKVLDYYEDLGIIELRPWPSFGNLPNDIAEKYPNIDNSAYIFAYFLALNICILEVKTTIGAVIDFDEIAVPRNGTTLDYATKEMTGTNVGALIFENNYVSMNPSIYTSDFSGVSSPTFYSKIGPQKFIFNASVIELCQVHHVESFIDKSKISKRSGGALLHLRFNVQTIFGITPPSGSFKYLDISNQCDVRVSTNPPRLRIFSLNGCLGNNKFLNVDLYYKDKISPTRMKIYGITLEENCPADWAPTKLCFYSPHTFVSNLLVTEGLTKVVIELGLRKVDLLIREIHKPVQHGLTMCVQPVYYYTQWQNIVLYIEAWRAQGATRFIVFYHSSTKDTRKLLDYYQKLGVIELRSWPSFGNLHKDIVDKKPNIDNNTFLFSYFLALNICVLDIKTTFGTVADFDEVIVPINGTMLDYATKEMTGTDVGALLFESNYVAMNPSIYTSDFSGVSSPSFYRKGLNKIQTIFGSSPPPVPMESLNVFVECGLRQFKQGICHGASCKPEMDAVHEWVYDKTEGLFLAGEY